MTLQINIPHLSRIQKSLMAHGKMTQLKDNTDILEHNEACI